MNLYHGTVIGGLDVILANSKSHKDGSKVAYFTTDRVYALVCCRPKTENFVTMGLRGDKKQHYYERFPNQLRVMYEGREGFIYQPTSTLQLENIKERSWGSKTDVPVTLCDHITNVYEEILKEEKAGNVIIHRYEEIDPEERQMIANGIKEELEKGNFSEYREFLYRNFSPLWDRC